jgi:hypothetical protein
VAAKLKDDGSDSENEGDCHDGGVRVHEADAHVPPEDLRIEYEKQKEGKRKQRDEIKYGEYRNCDFIMDSGAEIERVWSAAEKILNPCPLQHSSSFARGHLFSSFQ